MVQTAPVNQTESLDFENFYHWYVFVARAALYLALRYLEIVPRMSSCGGLAGFEMGSGMMSCSSLPEDNAKRLLGKETKE